MRGGALIPSLRLLIVCAVYYGLFRLGRWIVDSLDERWAASSASPPAAPAPAATSYCASPTEERLQTPSTGELRLLAEWAFDYERMVIASDDATRAQREHALYVVSRLIVPLVGRVRVCEVDDELVRSVRRVLAVQLREDQAADAGLVWTHFIGWVRYAAAPPERRNSRLYLDPDVTHVYDEFTDW